MPKKEKKPQKPKFKGDTTDLSKVIMIGEALKECNPNYHRNFVRNKPLRC